MNNKFGEVMRTYAPNINSSGDPPSKCIEEGMEKIVHVVFLFMAILVIITVINAVVNNLEELTICFNNENVNPNICFRNIIAIMGIGLIIFIAIVHIILEIFVDKVYTLTECS